jgi:hypothetical protein
MYYQFSLLLSGSVLNSVIKVCRFRYDTHEHRLGLKSGPVWSLKKHTNIEHRTFNLFTYLLLHQITRYSINITPKRYLFILNLVHKHQIVYYRQLY